MSMTLLQLIQETAKLLGGMASPSFVVSNTNQKIIELLSCANFAGNYLNKKYEWQRALIEHVFETTAKVTLTGNISASGVITGLSDTSSLLAGMLCDGTGVQTWSEIASVDSGTQVTLNLSATAGTSISFDFLTQDYALPSDYSRLSGNTQWDRTNFWPNLGPQTSQQWAWLKGGVLSTGPRFRYRIYRNKLRLSPAPSTTTTQSFEYLTKNWVLITGGTHPSKTSFTVDTDTCIFDDELMVLAIQYFWQKSKGLEHTVTGGLLNDLLEITKSQDIPKSILSLSNHAASTLISPYNIPETGYGD